MGDAGRDDDKMSKLTDPLIHHILSFLPFKFAVRTSILSKRWRNVWVFTPVLDFRKSWPPNYYYEEYRMQTKELMNSVDNMLSFQDNMPNMKALYLEICDPFDGSRVKEWVSTVIRRKVEELIIDFVDIGSFTLPSNLFTCESLTLLELNIWFDLKLPESISFPRLKILRLSYVGLEYDDSTQQLVSNSPILEELILKECNFGYQHILSICTPTLKFLSIEDYDGRNEYPDERVVEIYAPSLLSLKYSEDVAGDYDLPCFPSLVDAEIEVKFLDKTTEDIFHAASKLIGGLLNVKLLKLSGNTFEIIS